MLSGLHMAQFTCTMMHGLMDGLVTPHLAPRFTICDLLWGLLIALTLIALRIMECRQFSLRVAIPMAC